MRFSVEHTYPIAAERFFTEMFFDADYNQTLYLKGLGFAAFTVEREDRDADGRVQHRTAAVRPRLNMPKPVEKLLGTAFTYREVGALMDGAWHSEIIPSRLADKLALKTIMRVQPVGEDTCLRIAEFDIQVRLFGVGKIMERFIERTLRESYQKATRHSVAWLNARAAG
jgi:hypothetical protein